MRIALVQPKLKIGDVDYNFKIIENYITKIKSSGADTIVLPEMWNTSFFPNNVYELADNMGESTVAFLSDLARSLHINIIGGSVVIKEGDKLLNRSYIFGRDGKLLSKYDKVHLFSPSEEDKIFLKGDKLSTFEIDRIKCGICICYDLRFSEWIRMNALTGIDILFLPAAWPDKRINHWEILNRARAIENQIFVVSTNSVGKTSSMKFGGHSMIVDPWGEYIINAKCEEGVFIGEIKLDIIKEIRESINVFKDRREDIYKL